MIAVAATNAASASVPQDACAGQGTASTSLPLLYFDPAATGVVGLSHATNTTFTFNIAVGACATKGTIAAGGTVSGWCGLASGAGVTNNGHEFAFIGIGPVLVITGNLRGAVVVLPDIPNGEDCAQALGGSDSFLIIGAAELVDCVAGKSATTSTTTPLLGFVVYSKLPC